MRQIKFNFIYGVDGEPETYFNRTFTFGEIEGGCHFNEICDSPTLKKYSILAKRQFTGLLDKNGVEIYEGDILATNNGEQYSVKWSDEFFKFKISCRPKGFSHVQSMSMASQVSRLAEVIGNIHENPELINSEVMK